jgi:anthranilate/para-aminobenzoate synthase component II
MSIRHKQFPLFGMQFHPESFLTDVGPTLLERFLAV